MTELLNYYLYISMTVNDLYVRTNNSIATLIKKKKRISPRSIAHAPLILWPSRMASLDRRSDLPII